MRLVKTRVGCIIRGLQVRVLYVPLTPKTTEREKAIELRKQGLSLSKIAAALSISKSSASTYTRGMVDVAITEQLARKTSQDNQKKAIKAFSEQARLRRETFQKEGWELFKINDLFRQIVFLYWGEGSKGQSKAVITNTDPYILSYYVMWLETMDVKKWAFSVRYFEDTPFSQQQIIDWWKKYLPTLTADKIKKFTISKPKVSNRKARHPMGVGRVRVDSVRIRQIIEGGILHAKSLIDEKIAHASDHQTHS